MKTSELMEQALDWAVATAEGWVFRTEPTNWFGNKPWFERRHSDGISRCETLAYTDVWELAGPIIERECISILNPFDHYQGGGWGARKRNGNHQATGPTPLTAAMRCYVMSRHGESVEVPDAVQLAVTEQIQFKSRMAAIQSKGAA
ncbi:MAG: phage protein NinX family protein [Pseudomonadota bacterium]